MLGARDAYVAALSPLDREIRLASTAPVSEAAYLQFMAAQAEDWSDDEKGHLRTALLDVADRAAARGLHIERYFPAEIGVVRSTGKGEFGLPYTRAASIVLPAKAARLGDERLRGLLAHEMFHVLSRHSAELREKAYRLIGFTRGGELEMPPELAQRRITNPDGYQNDYQLALPRGDHTEKVVPFLVASHPAFDPAVGTFVLDYVDFELLAVDTSSGAVRARRAPDGKLDFIHPAGSAYLRCVGRNTEEVIHPDEVIAESFVLVLARGASGQEEEQAPSPGLVDDLESLLRTGESKAPADCRF